MNVIVHDNIVDSATHKKLYDWGQSVSWYTKPLPLQNDDSDPNWDPNRAFNFPIQEYSPRLMGNHVTRLDTPQEHRGEVLSLYRHMIGWSDESVKERNPLVYDLWTKINDKVFEGKGKLDGMSEGHGGTRGLKSNFIDQINFYEKYNVPKHIKLFTCFLNARHFPDIPQGQNRRRQARKIGFRFGQLHKDSDNSISDKYFSVLYILNLEWRPTWDGSIEFYSNEFTGDKHWKHEYNIGWPEKISANVPNRVIVYPHDQIHLTRNYMIGAKVSLGIRNH